MSGAKRTKGGRGPKKGNLVSRASSRFPRDETSERKTRSLGHSGSSTRSDAVDSDSVVLSLDGEGSSETEDGGFGGGVVG